LKQAPSPVLSLFIRAHCVPGTPLQCNKGDDKLANQDINNIIQFFKGKIEASGHCSNATFCCIYSTTTATLMQYYAAL
jgi:hypothetical protein